MIFYLIKIHQSKFSYPLIFGGSMPIDMNFFITAKRKSIINEEFVLCFWLISGGIGGWDWGIS